LAKDEPTAARRQTRQLLALLEAGLGQPPLHASIRAAIVGMLDVLGELDVERRYQLRERVTELLEELAS